MVTERRASRIMRKGFRKYFFDICLVVFMLLFSVTMLYPYLNQLAISLNDGTDASFGGITVFPRVFTWSNYLTIFNNELLVRSFLFTVIIVLVVVVYHIIICLGVAYPLSRSNLPGKDALTWFFIIPTYISAGIIPTFILYRYMHLLNNVLVYIIPCGFTFYDVLIMKTFLKSLPVSMEEAAKIDGANELQIMFRIMIPLSMPVIATVALWTGVAIWNNWTTTMYFVNKEELYTLQYVIMRIIKESDILSQMSAELNVTTGAVSESNPTAETVKAAAIIFSTVPIICSYPFLQKYFVQGVMIGAVKE